MEQTLVVIKPDAVERGLIGEIIKRIERVGLKVIASKMFIADKKLLNTHYPAERRELIEGIGQRTLDGYRELGLDAKKQFGHEDAHKIGLEVQKWLVDFMASGPVFAMVVEGPHAIEVVRKVRGSTSPLHAQPGTINGDYSFDSPALANKSSRPIRNLVHASGNREEAEFEIGLWFKKSEVFAYDTIHQKHMNV